MHFKSAQKWDWGEMLTFNSAHAPSAPSERPVDGLSRHGLLGLKKSEKALSCPSYPLAVPNNTVSSLLSGVMHLGTSPSCDLFKSAQAKPTARRHGVCRETLESKK
jgi:hypothetical protein